MPVFREVVVAMAAVIGLMFASDVLFGESDPRFDSAIYDAAFYAPRSGGFRFAQDVTPADRVNELFAQFFPGEVKRNKRYSALPVIIR